MKTFFKRKNNGAKPTAEKPRLFKQIREFQAQEALSNIQKGIFDDKLFWIFLSLWLVPIIATLAYAGLNYSNLPNQIPLFYSQPWGSSQLADKIYIFLPFAGVGFLGIFNFVFASMFHLQDKVFSYLLLGTAALLSVLSAITIFNIVNLMR